MKDMDMDAGRGIDLKAYGLWRDGLIRQIRQMRFRAVMQLNASNLAHYFSLGQEIIRKQQEMGWGKGVIKMLSEDLMSEFGKDSGYSDRNLRNMKRFANAYPDFPFWQVPLAQITWYHHITLIQKVSDPLQRAFYIIKTSQEGWSRDIMLMQIESDAYHRQGMALTNFSDTLPPEDSDLARYMFKDPYNFGFVDMSKVKRETDLENQLVLRISEFLTEMGNGFAMWRLSSRWFLSSQSLLVSLITMYLLLTSSSKCLKTARLLGYYYVVRPTRREWSMPFGV